MPESAEAEWLEFVRWCEEHGFEAVAPEDWDEDAEAGDTDVTVIGRADAGDPKDQPTA